MPFGRVVVFDNASDDDTRDIASSFGSPVHVVRSDVNLGFASGNNAAAGGCESEAILFLNPDTVALDGAIEALHAALITDGHDVVGPALLEEDGTIQQWSVHAFPSLVGIWGYWLGLDRRYPNSPFGSYTLPELDRSEPQEGRCLSGAAFMVRRRFWLAAGGFDEAFLHSGEDFDWFRRALQAGGRVGYVPSSRIIHETGGSTRYAGASLAGTKTAGLHRYLRKHEGVLVAAAFRALVALKSAVSVPLLAIWAGRDKARSASNSSIMRWAWGLQGMNVGKLPSGNKSGGGG